MRLYLVRHGQSEGNLAKPGAPHDPALTEIGRTQARLAGEWLASDRFAALYASPTIRALETAAIIGQALDLPTRVWACLAETPRVNWNLPADPARRAIKSGLTGAEVLARFDRVELREDVGDGTSWWETCACENRADAYCRAQAVLDALERAHGGEDEAIAVVAHGAFGSAMVATALGAAPVDYNRFSLFNCGITRVDFDEGAVRLRFHNIVEHLPTELCTDLTN